MFSSTDYYFQTDSGLLPSLNMLREMTPPIDLPYGRLAVRSPIFLGNRKETDKVIFDEWKYMHQKLFIELSKIFMFREETFSIKLFYFSMPGRDWHWELRLYAEISVFPNIPPGTRFAIPMYSYYEDSHSNSIKLAEWRCGYCKTPNVFEDKKGNRVTACEKCGAQRPMLLQEVMKIQ